MSEAFTPGPWKWTDTQERGCWVSGVLRGKFMDKDYVYPIINSRGVIDGLRVEVDLANAYLIAAAPDLLEALKALLDQFDAGYFVRNTEGDGSPDWVIKAARSVRTLAAGLQAIAKAEGKEIAQLKDAVL